MNEITGWGGTMKGGCIIEWWWRWGGGHSPKPHKNSRTIFNRVERSFSHLPGFQGFSVLTGRQEGSDRTAPFLPAAFKASFPLTHHATPRLISVTSTTEGQGFFFSPPPFFFSTLKLPFSRVEKTFVFFLFEIIIFLCQNTKVILNKLNMQHKITARTN